MAKLPAFLKPLKKGDHLSTVYLYKDGHAIAIFTRHDYVTGVRGTYVQVGAPGTLLGQEGYCGGAFSRIILQPSLARIIATLPGTVIVVAYPFGLKNGSTKSQEKNIPVSVLSI